MKPQASRCTPFRALRWPAKVNVVGLCAAIVAFSVLLWPVWLHDPDLTHGLFMPFLAVILAVESRRDPSARFLSSGVGPAVACAVLTLGSLCCLVVAFVYGATLDWTYSMAQFMVAAALVLAAAAAWLGFADQRVRFIPFNWPAAVAAALWIFAAPPPPGTYARLALFLQNDVTRGVTRVLHGIGIAAFQNGNVIELARTSVGVSEACSGVRSLISCTVAGLFLSAILVRKPAHRALVIVISPVIGLAMNFIRSLFLTLLANSGVSIEGRWHDLTGASILVGTTLLVTAFALWLHRREPPEAISRGEAPPVPSGRSPLTAMFASALLLAVVAAGVLLSAGHPRLDTSASVPNLEALLPVPPAGWTEQTTPDIDRYSSILHTHTLIERVYSAGPGQNGAHLTLYLAYWKPGEAPVSLVDAHTPDACWPGTGWESRPVANPRELLAIGDQTLAPAECRLFALGTFETHVWFWHLYGGKPLAFVDPYSALRILKLAWHYGFNQSKDQLFVRVSSDRPWPEIASQPALQQFFLNLKPLGL
jgi:exosortase